MPAREPQFILSLVSLVGVVSIMLVGLIYFDVELHILLLASILWVGINAALHGYKFEEIRKFMNAGIARALGAIYIFFLIGILIAALIEGGTIATIVYYALDIINPSWFLPAGLFFCCFMSLSTGTSWGTVGTAGVVLIGIGSVLGVPLPIVAGAVISGAIFGDKMSPVSDTTILAAACAGTELYSHIKAMLISTGPAFIVTTVIYTAIGLQFSGGVLPAGEIDAFQSALSSQYDIGLIALIPMFVLLLMSFTGAAAETSMISASLTAIAIAVAIQDRSLTEVLHSIQWGFTSTTGLDKVDVLLSRGGIQSMMWTLSLALIALALGGIIDGVGYARVLMKGVIARIKRAASLMATTIASGIVANMTMGENYLAIIFSSQLFKDAYRKMGLRRRMLSRCVEEGTTLTAALIPWTTTGAFFTAALGVQTVDYAPWVLLTGINIFISIGLAAFDIGVLRNDDGEPASA